MDVLLLGLTHTGLFTGDLGRSAFIRGDDRAFVGQHGPGLAEDLEELAGLGDRTRHQHCVAHPGVQAGFHLHIHDDVVGDLLQPVTARQHALECAPALLQRGLCDRGQPLGLGLEPRVDLARGTDPLVDIAGFIAQVQHHAVLDGLVKAVRFADIGPEGFQRCAFVGF